MESAGQLETNETDNSDGRTPRPLRGVGGVRPSEAIFSMVYFCSVSFGTISREERIGAVPILTYQDRCLWYE